MRLVKSITAIFAFILFITQPVMAEPLSSAESLDGKIKMDVTDLTRKNNVVTIKGSITNLSDSKFSKTWDGEEFFLLNEEKGVKYFVLRDESKRPLVSSYSYPGLGLEVEPKATMKFWAKFTAPPVEIKNVNLVFEGLEIMEGLPINDAG
jgi:hypothetical protein